MAARHVSFDVSRANVTRSGHGLGKVFGSNEVNVENWRSVKRLVGHENGRLPPRDTVDTSRCSRFSMESRQPSACQCWFGQCYYDMECQDIR